jgi:hypothetical protein
VRTRRLLLQHTVADAISYSITNASPVGVADSSPFRIPIHIIPDYLADAISNTFSNRIAYSVANWFTVNSIANHITDDELSNRGEKWEQWKEGEEGKKWNSRPNSSNSSNSPNAVADDSANQR